MNIDHVFHLCYSYFKLVDISTFLHHPPFSEACRYTHTHTRAHAHACARTRTIIVDTCTFNLIGGAQDALLPISNGFVGS